MEAGTLIALLTRRRALRRHQRWDRATLVRHQAHALTVLRAHAYQRSPFYQRFHRGLEDAPLDALPVLDKATLMDEYDDVATDGEIRLDEVIAQLARGDERPYLERYVVAATSGTTGSPTVLLFDRDEWTTHVASYSRAQDWAGVAAGLTRRVRMAIVSSRVPWHASVRVGATVDGRFVPTLRLDADAPLGETAAALEDFQPECLVGYASAIDALAAAQLDGRLRIAPRAVIAASEVLTAATRARARAAWGSEPFDVYVATETAGLASACARRRLHLYEDLVVVEPVDERRRPVPPGVAAATVLVTVLFSRTLPLIRYDLGDRVVPAAGACDCGIRFGLLERIDGRATAPAPAPAPASWPASASAPPAP